MSTRNRTFIPQKGAPLFALAAAALPLAIGSFLFLAPAPRLPMGGMTMASAPDAARPRPTVTPVSSDALPHVTGKRITTVVVEFPPGGGSPPHHHGGSVSVYVLSGAIRSQLAGGPIGLFKAGDTFFEPPGITHLVAENASMTEPARILAVFVADEGATLTTYHE